jgi:hypothetical protein
VKHSAVYLWLVASGILIAWIGFEAGTDGIGPKGCHVCSLAAIIVGVISAGWGVGGLATAGRARGQVGAIR